MGYALRPRLSALLLVAALSFVPACFAAGPAYVDVAYVPRNYATYPSYVYDGANVYYIDGRWYRQYGGRWVYYRSEPRDLYRYRTHSHVVVAPPARRPVYRAPPRHDHRDERRYRAPPRQQRAPARDARESRPARREREYRAPAREDRRRGRD